MKNKKVKLVIYAVVFIALILLIVIPAKATAPYGRQWGLPFNRDKEVLTVADKITIAAIKHGVDINEALNVAWCESRHDERARNNTSTARGTYQFIFKTWDNYCTGDVKNADDNIACFMKLYPKHKGWWECSKILGYTK